MFPPLPESPKAFYSGSRVAANQGSTNLYFASAKVFLTHFGNGIFARIDFARKFFISSRDTRTRSRSLFAFPLGNLGRPRFNRDFLFCATKNIVTQ
jgi:hypothetical protein